MNTEQKKSYMQRYRAEHKLQIQQYNLAHKLQKQQYSQANKEKIREQRKQHYHLNKERIRAQQKQYELENKDKVEERKKQYRITHKDQIKQQRKKYDLVRGLLKRYNITLEQRNQMLADQKGVCAICGNPFGNTSPCVDHCHITGKVRGLLHPKCNIGLGYFDDDLIRLNQAANYLLKHVQK